MASIWISERPLLLASTSATRRHLLESAGLPVEMQAPGIDERAIEAEDEAGQVDPPALALRLGTEKALAVSRMNPGRLVLGADQVLACGPRVLHKPAGWAEARDQLLDLAGQTHALQSAGVLVQDEAVLEKFSARALLTMRPLAPEQIDAYLDLVEPEAIHGAGVYRLEGFGIHLFDAIEGDHSTILGLPLIPLLAALRRLGTLVF